MSSSTNNGKSLSLDSLWVNGEVVVGNSKGLFDFVNTIQPVNTTGPVITPVTGAVKFSSSDNSVVFSSAGGTDGTLDMTVPSGQKVTTILAENSTGPAITPVYGSVKFSSTDGSITFASPGGDGGTLNMSSSLPPPIYASDVPISLQSAPGTTVVLNTSDWTPIVGYDIMVPRLSSYSTRNVLVSGTTNISWYQSINPVDSLKPYQFTFQSSYQYYSGESVVGDPIVSPLTPICCNFALIVDGADTGTLLNETQSYTVPVSCTLTLPSPPVVYDRIRATISAQANSYSITIPYVEVDGPFIKLAGYMTAQVLG